MKTNEAPEKLYFGLQGDTGILDIYSKRESENDIEYVREDTFIEKACGYLSYHLDTNKIDVNYKFEFIEEFKNYMKGE